MSVNSPIDFEKDYYTILGVMPSAEDVVIKGAYRALAQRYHPDRFDGAAEEANRHMSALNEAYWVLSDPELRKTYDAQYRQPGLSLARQVEGTSFEVEQYRPFAERLFEWGYDEHAIGAALIARGVRADVAQFLAHAVSMRSASE